MPDWYPDELAYAGRENLDPAHIARYDTKEHAGADAEVAFLQGHGMGPDATVVDLGAGTGQFTLAVAPHVARVTAVDVSPPMLERLRGKLVAAASDRVEIVRAGFLTFETAPVDVVYSRLVLHHLPDFWKAVALRRVHAMLRPGGLFRLVDVVFDFDVPDADARLEAWCASAGSETDQEWTRAEYAEHLRDEHSTFTWLLEPMLTRAGFTIVDADHDADGIFASYLLRA